MIFLLTVIVVPIFVPLIHPFPEIVRYQTVARSLFVLVYTIFDIDINFWERHRDICR